MHSVKVLLVAGARPNFMKIASIVDAIATHNRLRRKPLIHPLLVHTGQHYGEQMSRSFFRDLGMPQPDVELEVGSASHAHQTAEIMKRFEPCLIRQAPDALLVVGDVNSTVACSLVASKISYSNSGSGRTRPLIAHVEAGLRSFDRSMPEEINRILTDVLSDLLFVSEPSGVENLLREGTARKKIHRVGNTMVDTLLKHRNSAMKSSILSQLGLDYEPTPQGEQEPHTKRKENWRHRACLDYAVVTLHRPSNVDQRQTFQVILEALSEIAKIIPVFFPVHPRTTKQIQQYRFEKYFSFDPKLQARDLRGARIQAIEPLGYLDFLCLMSNARLVLTDSGGIQEETSVLGIPCVTLRENTERPVTLTEGTNVLAGTDKARIVKCALRQMRLTGKPNRPKYWDGKTGERIIKILIDRLCK
ncbi:MAG TPA: UDP-N-acetylglucosamine 2-epimerase (non-hydrolyzing) [Terriglobia bacterium]|nr:UDP-N-acetylglucosamine 2-epimerase (non-hydrolyzing) [Terriglobia bacterium]